MSREHNNRHDAHNAHDTHGAAPAAPAAPARHHNPHNPTHSPANPTPPPHPPNTTTNRYNATQDDQHDEAAEEHTVSDTRRRILQLLTSDGPSTPAHLATALDMPRNSVVKTLRRMDEDGQLDVANGVYSVPLSGDTRSAVPAVPVSPRGHKPTVGDSPHLRAVPDLNAPKPLELGSFTLTGDAGTPGTHTPCPSHNDGDSTGDTTEEQS